MSGFSSASLSNPSVEISKFDVPEESNVTGGLMESDFAGTGSLDKKCNLLVNYSIEKSTESASGIKMCQLQCLVVFVCKDVSFAVPLRLCGASSRDGAGVDSDPDPDSPEGTNPHLSVHL